VNEAWSPRSRDLKSSDPESRDPMICHGGREPHHHRSRLSDYTFAVNTLLSHTKLKWSG
jgi:hypothetical protein